MIYCKQGREGMSGSTGPRGMFGPAGKKGHRGTDGGDGPKVTIYTHNVSKCVFFSTHFIFLCIPRFMSTAAVIKHVVDSGHGLSTRYLFKIKLVKSNFQVV